jgi:hypothetical protein
MLAGEAGAATKYLQSKLQGQIKIQGKRIEIADVKGRDVKLLLHEFLLHEGLTGYRVLSQSGTLKIVPEDTSPREEQPENDEIKGVPPFPPLSTERLPLMDIVYPNYTSNRFKLPRKFKKGKNSFKKTVRLQDTRSGIGKAWSGFNGRGKTVRAVGWVLAFPVSVTS